MRRRSTWWRSRGDLRPLSQAERHRERRPDDLLSIFFAELSHLVRIRWSRRKLPDFVHEPVESSGHEDAETPNRLLTHVDVAVCDAPGDVGEVSGLEVERLLSDLEVERALDHIESLILKVVYVHGRTAHVTDGALHVVEPTIRVLPSYLEEEVLLGRGLHPLAFTCSGYPGFGHCLSPFLEGPALYRHSNRLLDTVGHPLEYTGLYV